jgi:DNA-binding transcriptional regulator/RsmH inhibitor MraZ
LPDLLAVIDNMILPSNYVPVELVEKLFRSHRSFHYFLSRTKDEDIESRGGAISRLSLPDVEMRQHKREIMMELFGKASSRDLDTTQRLRLAKELYRRYNCSIKQISRLVGLDQAGLESFLK